jgi:hypothetical protein
MAFVKGEQKPERRKTRHLTEEFRNFVTEQIGKATGFDLDERQAWTIFKLSHKLPMRFLITINDPADFDGRGERAISVPGIGKYKFRMTVPQGKKDELGNDIITKNLMPDGTYPRLKFYPASAIENEVEVLHGIADKEVKDAYDKMIESEARHIERNAKEIAKMAKKLAAAESAGLPVHEKELSLAETIEAIIKAEIKKEVAKITGHKVEEKDENPNTPSVEPDEADEDIKESDDAEDTDETADEPEKVVEPPKEKKTRKSKKNEEVKPAEQAEVVAEEVKAPMPDETVTAPVDNAAEKIDTFDFDFEN